MQTITVKTDSAAHAKLLSYFLKTVSIVKSVSIEPDVESSANGVVSEPLSEYNWTNPSRPATDEEIEQMLDECEKSEGYPIEEARKMTKQWIKENLK